MPLVTSTFTIRLRACNMDPIEKQEAELKKRLENVDTLDERREIRRELRELRRQAEQLEAKKDLNANIITEKIPPAQETKASVNHNSTADDTPIRVRTAEERRSRREARLNERNKGTEQEEATIKPLEEACIDTNQNVIKEPEKEKETIKENSKEHKVTEKDSEVEINTESSVERNKDQPVSEKGVTNSDDTPKSTEISTADTTSEIGDKTDEPRKAKEDKAEEEKTNRDVGTKTDTVKQESAHTSDPKEQFFASKMNGPMRSLSLRNKDTSDGREGNRFDRGTRSSLFGDKSRAKNTIGKALSVSQMKDKFGQGGASKPIEFGTSFSKKTPEKTQEMAKPLPSTTKLRETNTSESYKREVPRPKQHHKTAPAGIIPPKQEEEKPAFAVPGMGGSAADRLAYFRQAAEKEKARKEKEAERQRLQSAPAEITTEVKENRTAPCKKKLDSKRPLKRTKSISSIVLDWCKEMVREYNVEIKNFSSSWNDGMAFCALIHRFESDAFDFKELKPENREHNFRLAFETASNRKNIPSLLDVEDMVRMKNPEPRSVQCYIQWIWRIYGPTSGSYNEDEIKAAQVS